MRLKIARLSRTNLNESEKYVDKVERIKNNQTAASDWTSWPPGSQVDCLPGDLCWTSGNPWFSIGMFRNLNLSRWEHWPMFCFLVIMIDEVKDCQSIEDNYKWKWTNHSRYIFENYMFINIKVSETLLLSNLEKTGTGKYEDLFKQILDILDAGSICSSKTKLIFGWFSEP